MLKNPASKWVALGIAAGALLALVGWLFVVSPQRSAAADHWAELAAAQAQTGSLRASNASLASQMAEIDARRAALAVKQEALPEVNSLDALVAAVGQAAAASGVELEEVTAGVPVDIAATLTGVGVVETPVVAEGGEDGDEEAVAAVVAPVTPFYALPVTIRAIGPLANLQEFVRLIQSEQARAVLFTSLVMANDEGAGSLEEAAVLTAQTQVFVSPGVATVPLTGTVTVPAG